MKRLFATGDSYAGPVLRLLIGVVMFAHGAQKLLGWYGGPGYAGTIGSFSDMLGVAPPITVLVIVGEFFGGLALIAGLLTRFCAVSIGVIMLGAVALVHWPNGLFMNWFGNQAGEGFEYHLLALAICAALTIEGGGRWSVDGWIAERWFGRNRPLKAVPEPRRKAA
ncbi:MAG: DoxX family protein [Nitrospirae bacterium]|nr:DoxX family protein [Nitrospirota bacterium]